MAQKSTGEQAGASRGAKDVSDKFHKEPRGGKADAAPKSPDKATARASGVEAQSARETRPESMSPGKRTQSK